jgi:O-antigen/teichoic acid export membrane protein
MTTVARKDHVTGPAFLLVAGRTVGLIATFAIALIFARIFSLEEMGTYKAFFLVYMTMYGLAQLGMAESLYYFVPRAAGNIGRYVCNAALTLLVAGLACLALLWGFRAPIAEYASNPALADITLLLGLFLTLTLVGTVLEITMISRKQHMSAAITYALSDFGRTALFIIPALLFVSIRAVFIGAVIFAAVRLAMMLVVVWRQYGREFRPDLALWRTQLAYALPFAMAVGVEVVLINYHQGVVLGRFDPGMFAIYAIGVTPIPLVDLIMTSTTSVMMVKMAEDSRDRHAALGLFHETVSRLTFLMMPLSFALVALASPFIITMFTAKFAASVPIFTIWALSIIPAVFAVDAMLRVYAQTRFLLITNIVRLAFVAALIGWFLGGFGPVGAVLVTLVAAFVGRGLGVIRIARLLQVPVRDVLPWAALTRITARAAAAAVPAWLVAKLLESTPPVALVAGGAVYAIAYLVLCYAPGIAEPAAIRLPIMDRLRRLYAGSAAPNPAHTVADPGSVGRVPHSGPAATEVS